MSGSRQWGSSKHFQGTYRAKNLRAGRNRARHVGDRAAADAILRFKGELAEAQDIDAVRLLEARAAKLFWSRWAGVPIRWPLKDKPRLAAHWKVFGSRISPLTHSPRLAANPPNACMNLIHALCEAECRIALISMGLDPEVGMLRGKKVREIAESMRVSQPYAAFIRSGHRRPHKRHWEKLGGLVGVSTGVDGSKAKHFTAAIH